jgi:transglutaminase-like putative cysteine protease
MFERCDRKLDGKILTFRVPKGTSGTLVTARMIARLIREGAKDFCVRQKAIAIFRAARVRPKNRFGEVCALFDWVRRNVRYTRDIFRVELLHTARNMLALRAGDCDDMTILLGAMLMSTGYPVRLVLAGFKRSRPHAYTHIYPEVHVLGRWLAADPTVSRPIGFAPPAIWKRVCDIQQETIRCSPKTRTPE